MLHSPEPDQSSSAPEPSFAVDSNSSAVRLSEVVVGHFHELFHDGVGRGGAVDEEEIIVVDVGVQEGPLIVLFFVEPDDPFDIELLENLHVLLRVVAVALVCISLFDRSHKGHELAWDDPVEVPVLDPLVELVLLDVEGFEVVPLELNGVLQALQALQESAFVQAVAFTGISVVLEELMIGFEGCVSLLGGALHDDDHEAGHEEGPVDHLVGLLAGAVVEHSVFLVVLVFQKSRQFSRVPMDHGQVQRSEILVERKICKIVVNVEEVGVFVILRRLGVRHPV